MTNTIFNKSKYSKTVTATIESLLDLYELCVELRQKQGKICVQCSFTYVAVFNSVCFHKYPEGEN